MSTIRLIAVHVLNAGTFGLHVAACGGGGGSPDARLVADARIADAGIDAPVICPPVYEPEANPPANPPFLGTVWITPDLITDQDPTAYVDATYKGTGKRTVYDSRTASFYEMDAHLIDVRFGTTKTVEFQINPEFTQAEAQANAELYGTGLGRVPGFLFADLDAVWMHRGSFPFGGGNRSIVIHTDMGADYIEDGFLEEVFIHEGGHTSMDPYHLLTPEWMAAQAADGVALSNYARDFPMREDLAETIGPYLQAKFRSSRDSLNVAAIRETIPNRMRYLDCLGLTMALVP